MGASRPRPRVWALLAVSVAVAGPAASPARGADRVYWANLSGGEIEWAALDGSGGHDLDTGAPVGSPSGVAIDAAAGRVYWADENGPISYAGLDGGEVGELDTTGVATSEVRGLTIDPALGRVYWVNRGAPEAEAIAYASLDGTERGYLDHGVASPPASPTGLAIDPATNRIYWASQGGAKISYANLDGSGGGGDLNTTGASIDEPSGLALDPLNGRIYVTEQGGGVSYVALDESGGQSVDLSPLSAPQAYGAAFDPVSGAIYFADLAGAIDRASPIGGGEVLSTGGASSGSWLYPAILAPPLGTGAPTVSGGSSGGSTLSCTPGSWAGDLLGSYLYRAPRGFAYQWSRDGADIGGATLSTLVATSSGSYRCRVTASNAAGSAAQTSGAFAVSAAPVQSQPPPAPASSAPANRFAFGRPRLNRKRGTASLPIRVPGPGLLRSTVGLAASSKAGASSVNFVGAAGTVRIAVAASGKLQKKLYRTRKIKVRVTVVFTPNGGTAASQSRLLTLVRRRP